MSTPSSTESRPSGVSSRIAFIPYLAAWRASLPSCSDQLAQSGPTAASVHGKIINLRVSGHGTMADISVNQTSPDPVAVLAALRLNNPLRITPVTGGADATIWRVGYDDADYALRLLRADQAGVARREAEVMAAVAGAGIPVPRVFAEGIWDNRPALLMSWMPGRLLQHELEGRTWRSWALGVQFGRTQAAIHAMPVPVALRRHPVSWIEWAEPDAALRNRLRRSRNGEI